MVNPQHFVATELQRLNACLPLASRQRALPPVIRVLHQKILRFLYDHARVPLVADLPAGPDLYQRLRALAAADLVVLDSKTGLPLGAYPLTSESTPHCLTINNRRIHAMCALDAVSVAPMFGGEVVIDSVCQQTETPIRLIMRDDEIIKKDSECLIGIRWQSPSAVAAYSLCVQMVFLRDPNVARLWQENDHQGVSLLSLATAIDVGRAFFRPLLEDVPVI